MQPEGGGWSPRGCCRHPPAGALEQEEQEEACVSKLHQQQQRGAVDAWPAAVRVPESGRRGVISIHAVSSHELRPVGVLGGLDAAGSAQRGRE